MDTLANRGKAGEWNASQLKLIAIFGMTLDHIGIVFGDYMPLGWEIALYALGGLTFPIMAFLLTEGYRHTSNFKRYILRLLIFAAISYLPFAWAMQSPHLNVLFTLTLGAITLHLHEHMKNRVAFWFIFIGLILVSVMMDWSLMGVPMVLLYHVLKGKYKRFIIPILLPIGLIFCMSFIAPGTSPAEQSPGLAFAFIGCSLTVPLLMGYNGRRAGSIKVPKYLFYAYYPVHLLVLSLLRGLLFGDWAFVSGFVLM